MLRCSRLTATAVRGGRLAHTAAMAAPRPVSIDTMGVRIEGLAYGSPDATKKVIGIHGWMDNAATHRHIAPVWTAAGYEFLAIDLPGHGRSGKRHIGDTYSASSYAATVMEAANALKWKHFALCSHSMGAGISSMVAGAWSQRVTGLVLLEGIGMNSKEVDSAPAALAAAVQGKEALQTKRGGSLPSVVASGASAAASTGSSTGNSSSSGPGSKVYASLSDAAKARVATVKKYPGNQAISYQAALTLVERGTAPVPGSGDAAAAAPTTAAAGFRFLHDSRLMEPSPFYLSESMMLAYLQSIRCPTLCVTGTTGWPWSFGLMLGRIASVRDMEHHHILGGHHCHLDEDTAPTVASIVGDFIRRRKPGTRAYHHASSSVEHVSAATLAARGGDAQSVIRTSAAQAALAGAAPTGSGAAGSADEEVVEGAQSIASTTVARPSSAGGGATDAVPDEPVDHHFDRVWSDRHVYIATTVPSGSVAAALDLDNAWAAHCDDHCWASTSPAAGVSPTAPAGAPGCEGPQRKDHVHVHANVLTVKKMAPDYQPLYKWRLPAAAARMHQPPRQPAQAAAGSAAPAEASSAPSTAPAASQSAASAARGSALVWVDLPDNTTGFDRSFLSKAGHGHLAFGAWVPRVFLETMPTLEAVTGQTRGDVSKRHPGSGDAGEGDAGSVAGAAGLAALEAKGNSY